VSINNDDNQDGNNKPVFIQALWLFVPTNYLANRLWPKGDVMKHVDDYHNGSKVQERIEQFYGSGGKGIDLKFNEAHVLYGLIALWNMSDNILKDGGGSHFIKFSERELHRAMRFDGQPTGRNRDRIRENLCGLATKQFPILWGTARKTNGGRRIYASEFNTVIKIHGVSDPPGADGDSHSIKEKITHLKKNVDFHNLEVSLNYKLFSWGGGYQYVNPNICMEIKAFKAKKNKKPSHLDIRFYDWLAREQGYTIKRHFKKVAKTPLLMNPDYINSREPAVRDKVTELYDFFVEMGYLEGYELDNGDGPVPLDILKKNRSKFRPRRSINNNKN